jgi:SAM-dependent methyltransferase
VADLGCGTGALTASLAGRWQPSELVGLDASAAMLAEAAPLAAGPLRFVEGDLADPPLEGPFDVIVSNAALQWVPDHAEVLARWSRCWRPAGSSPCRCRPTSATPPTSPPGEVAHEPRSSMRWAATSRPTPSTRSLRPRPTPPCWTSSASAVSTCACRSTATTSVDRGRGRVDEGHEPHPLPHPDGPGLFEAFVDRYRQRVLDVLGDHAPYFYAFRRILLWGGGRPERHRPEWCGGDRPGTVGGPPGRGGATFVERHPRSAELAAGAAAHLLGGVPMPWMTRWPGAFPIFVEDAKAATCTDVDGHTYVDFCLGDTGP